MSSTPKINVDNEQQNDSREMELRKLMINIQNDTQLSPREKAQKMQELMTKQFLIKRPSSRNSSVSRDNSSIPSPRSTHSSHSDPEISDLLITDEDVSACYVDKEGAQILGCDHYQTAAKVRAECCGNWYVCRFCHDEAEDHPIDRFAIKFMICMYCGMAQRCNQTCQSCNQMMAEYFCFVCNLWDNDKSKDIYHCEQCRICRRGKREDYKHCARCGGCISASFFDSHTCRDGTLESNCPICNEGLFGSTSAVHFMTCGHAIHYWCFQDYARNSYQCPICLKSVVDTTYFFKCIEDLLATQQMPEEYANKKSVVLCNDCQQKSTAPFHFIYHKCGHCGSYNTKALGLVNEEN